MTDLLAALPPKPLPAEIRATVGSGLENTPGLENDHLDIGQFWSTDEGPTFAEFLDIINPLQHIPVVSSLYRAISGDEIGPGPRVAGGMLFGGPVGALVAGVTALFEEASGGDIGEHIADFIDDFIGGGDGGGGDDAPNVAAAPAHIPAGPQAAIQAETQTGPRSAANVQQAAIVAPLAMAPSAARLNRIAVNPGAALGAVQRPVHNPVQNAAPNAGRPALSASNAAFPTRHMATPFGGPASIKPSPIHRSPANSPTLRPAVFTSAAAGQAGQAREAIQPAARTAIAAPQVSDAVTRSRRQQADLMLAQWAAQQMAQQSDRGNAHTDSRPATAAPAHPMLPPRNASPEWYAQAMDQALNRYRNGASTGASAAPAVSLRR